MARLEDAAGAHARAKLRFHFGYVHDIHRPHIVMDLLPLTARGLRKRRFANAPA
jgi:hypothetical protein